MRGKTGSSEREMDNRCSEPEYKKALQKTRLPRQVHITLMILRSAHWNTLCYVHAAGFKASATGGRILKMIPISSHQLSVARGHAHARTSRFPARSGFAYYE